MDFKYEVGEEKNQIDVFSSWHGASLKPPSEKITTALTNIPDEALAEDNKGLQEEAKVHAYTASPQRPTHEEVEENMR